VSWVAVGVGVAGVATAGIGAATAPSSPETPDPHEMTYENWLALQMMSGRTYLTNAYWNPAFSGLANRSAEESLFGTPGKVWMQKGRDGTRKRRVIPASPGLLDIYQRAGNRMADFNRQQQVKDMNLLGPATMSAYLRSNPLAGSLMQRASDGMAQGGELDASTRRTLQQSAFGDASMRGFGHSPLDAFMA
jgi:hypothetical protein